MQFMPPASSLASLAHAHGANLKVEHENAKFVRCRGFKRPRLGSDGISSSDSKSSGDSSSSSSSKSKSKRSGDSESSGDSSSSSSSKSKSSGGGSSKARARSVFKTAQGVNDWTRTHGPHEVFEGAPPTRGCILNRSMHRRSTHASREARFACADSIECAPCGAV